MSLLNKLTEAVLNELHYSQFKSKQRSITKLFPKFNQRKEEVYANGGVRLSERFPELWWFKVASGTTPGVEYDVYLRFKNIIDTVKKFIGNRELWTKDGLRCNYNLLAAQVFNSVDLESECSCKSNLYHGFAFIKTQRQAQFGDQENRAPNIKNPRQFGIVCKHGSDMFDRLPFFTGDFSAHLKVFYGEDIQKMVDEIREQSDEEVPPQEQPKEVAVEEPKEEKYPEDVEKDKSDKASTFYKGKIGDSVVVRKVNKWKLI